MHQRVVTLYVRMIDICLTKGRACNLPNAIGPCRSFILKKKKIEKIVVWLISVVNSRDAIL